MRVGSVLILLVATLSGCVSPNVSTDVATDPAESKETAEDAAGSGVSVGVGGTVDDAATDVKGRLGGAQGAVDGASQQVQQYIDLDAVTGPTSAGMALIGFLEESWPDPEPGDYIGGLEVIHTLQPIHVAVVAADDLRQARLAVMDVTGILYIEDDNLLATQAVPDDPGYGDQYGPDLVGARAAWDHVGYGRSDVTVAVLDTGIRRTHEDLTGRVLAGYDYVNDDNDPSDDCGHGTHVAGTAAGTTDNGRGVAGMSQSNILPMKVLGPFLLAALGCSGTASDISQAIIDSTLQGADVISMSLGGGESNTMRKVVDWAHGRGATLVAAAGNNGDGVDCPACYGSVIAVGAVNADRSLASYSNAGAEVEIAAPGTDVWSADDASDASYKARSGTSMATPHVAGALALALSCDPSLTNAQLRSLLRSTAEDLGAPGRDASFGFGLLRIDRIVQGLSCIAPPTSGGGSSACGEGDASTILSGDPNAIDLVAGEWAQRRICVQSGQELQVDLSGPECSLVSCGLDADLYVRQGAAPDEDAWDCRPYLTGNSESCSVTAASTGWVYVGIHAASGSGTVQLTATA